MKNLLAVLILVFVFTKATPLSNRITGGQTATPHSFKHQAALYITVPRGSGFCGGSIISETIILTAAHCVRSAINVTILVGAHDLTLPETTTQTFYSNKIVVHDEWNIVFRHDIALVILQEKIVFNEYVQKIELPNAGETVEVGQEAIVSGWGFTSDETQSINSELQFVTSEIIPLDVCNIFYYGLIDETQICLSGTNKKSSCRGDSGGALITKLRGKSIQYGIVSFQNVFYCEIGYPSVYTNVASHVNWINQHIQA